jgi:hypothetical protein
MPRSRRALLLCVPLAAAPLVLPFATLFVPALTYGINVGLLPLYVFEKSFGWAAFYCALVLALALAFALVAGVRRDRAGYLTLAVVLTFGASGLLARASSTSAAAEAGRCLATPGWVDASLPPGARAVLVAGRNRTRAADCALTETAFANRSIAGAYTLGRPLLGGLPEPARASAAAVAAQGGARFVVTDSRFPGRVLARERSGLRLYELAALR